MQAVSHEQMFENRMQMQRRDKKLTKQLTILRVVAVTIAVFAMIPVIFTLIHFNTSDFKISLSLFMIVSWLTVPFIFKDIKCTRICFGLLLIAGIVLSLIVLYFAFGFMWEDM